MSRVFLTAEWRNLILANYAVERAVLEPYVPAGTQLDTFQGKPYVSLVAFQFLKTRLYGVPIPFHTDFEEINLRFYVRRFNGEEWRRGVVFLKEIVPKWAIATVARLTYGENYISYPTKAKVGVPAAPAAAWGVKYDWQMNKAWHSASAEIDGASEVIACATKGEFICENYWGYTRHPAATLEYKVEHEPWKLWKPASFQLSCDFTGLVSPELAAAVAGPPASVFVADGGPVKVHEGRRI